MRNKTPKFTFDFNAPQGNHCASQSFRAKLRRFVLPLLLAASVLALSNASFAQDRWNAALRTGVNFPTSKLGGTDLKTGFGFDGTIGYRVMPHLFVNAGWGWNRFASDNNGKNDYEETGYILGFRFVHPISQSKLSYVAGINALYNHIEVENSNGDLIADTGHGWGWQADAGIGIQVGKRTKLIPSVRYRSLSRDLKVGNAAANAVDLNYFSAGLGLSFDF